MSGPAAKRPTEGGRLVLIGCVKCQSTTTFQRPAGAHTLMVRGNRLLSNAEAMTLKERGWRIEPVDVGDGVRDHWVCPRNNHPAVAVARSKEQS